MRHKPFWDYHSQEAVTELIQKLSRRAGRLGSLEDREKALQASIQAIPAAGPKRTQALLQLQAALDDPEQIMSAGCAEFLAAYLEAELLRDDFDYEDVEILCAIAGRSGQERLVPALEDLYAHAASAGIQGFARAALLELGLSAEQIDSRKPIKTILLFEPNAFFLNRLATALKGHGLNPEVAGTREEAEALLAERKVDLIISESHDGAGDLWIWLSAQWKHRRCNYVLLSTSNREPGPLVGKPWIIGRLYKPYHQDELIKAIEA